MYNKYQEYKQYIGNTEAAGHKYKSTNRVYPGVPKEWVMFAPIYKLTMINILSDG